MNLLDKILLSNYSLSVMLCRKKVERYMDTTYYISSNQIFFTLLAIIAIIIPIIPYQISDTENVILIVFIAIFSFYCIQKRLKYHLIVKKGNIRQQYINLKGKTLIYTLFGWIFLIGSFTLLFISLKYNMEGYSLPDYQG